MLGRIQVTPRWANDPVWLHNEANRRVARVRFWHPPQTENRQRAEKVGAG